MLIGVTRNTFIDTNVCVWDREDRTKVTQENLGLSATHHLACSVSPSHSRCLYGWWRTATS
jgi:hypothetical protein